MPAPATPAAAKPRPKGRVATVSLATAMSIVVANMIGTGVFTSLGFQVKDMPSPFAILLLWLIGGVVALCGALSYAELAAALPRSGGEYHFLSRIFHPVLGFLAGWISVTVGFAAPIAATAMAFGDYLKDILPEIPSIPPTQKSLVLSVAIVWINSIVHFTGIRRGSVFQDLFTVLKVALILAFLIVGWFMPHPQPISFLPHAGDTRLLTGSAFAISLIYVMYAYSGWNASTYIVSEIRDPQRNVPRSVFFGTLLVLALYVAVNAVFLHTTPMQDFLHFDEKTHSITAQVNVGLIAGQHIFGPSGGNVMAALICIGLVSSISSMTWIGPRVTVAMGEDFPVLRPLATRTKNGIPRVALLVQLLIVNVLVFTATFDQIINYIQPVLTLFSLLTVLGVIVLRVRQPDLQRPYKTWGYPVTPLLFIAVSLWMLFYVVCSKPKESLAGFVTMLAGLIVYFVSSKTHKPETMTRDEN